MELGVKVYAAYRVKSSQGVIKLAAGSVVDFEGDAIVNAANVIGLGGGGVDGAIGRAGGPKLLQARQALPVLGGGIRIPEGEARTTPAFGDLKCRFVVHAVSANYNAVSSADIGDAIVRGAYSSALQEARKNGCKTIAYSLLSAGIFRGSQTLLHVLGLGAETVVKGITEGETVYFIAFSPEEIKTLQQAVLSVLSSTGELSEGI